MILDDDGALWREGDDVFEHPLFKLMEHINEKLLALRDIKAPEHSALFETLTQEFHIARSQWQEATGQHYPEHLIPTQDLKKPETFLEQLAAL